MRYHPLVEVPNPGDSIHSSFATFSVPIVTITGVNGLSLPLIVDDFGAPEQVHDENVIDKLNLMSLSFKQNRR